MSTVGIITSLSRSRNRFLVGIVLLAVTFQPAVEAEDPQPHSRLQDRGKGIPTSLFGTYIKGGELLVYPFYEYVTKGNDEYKPSELGFIGDQDFLGASTEHEALIFFGYGLSRSLAVEFEAAVWTKATLTKAENDMSALPSELEESGVGAVESQLRWLWRRETERRPAFYSFFEVEFPLQKERC